MQWVFLKSIVKHNGFNPQQWFRRGEVCQNLNVNSILYKNDDVDRRNTTPGDSRERSRSKMTTLINEIRRKIRKWIWKCVKNQKKARARPTNEKQKKKKTRKNDGGTRTTDFLAYGDRWSKKSIQRRSQLLAKSARRAQKEAPGCVAVLWRCAQKGRKCSFLKTPKSRNTK